MTNLPSDLEVKKYLESRQTQTTRSGIGAETNRKFTDANYHSFEHILKFDLEKKEERGLDSIVTFSEMIHFFLLHSWKHMERTEDFIDEGSVGNNLLLSS